MKTIISCLLFCVTALAQQVGGGLSQIIYSGALMDSPNRELSIPAGRWITTDPARSGWNQYAYGTNPLSGKDAQGLSFDYCSLTLGCATSWPNAVMGITTGTDSGGEVPASFDGDAAGVAAYAAYMQQTVTNGVANREAEASAADIQLAGVDGPNDAEEAAAILAMFARLRELAAASNDTLANVAGTQLAADQAAWAGNLRSLGLVDGNPSGFVGPLLPNGEQTMQGFDPYFNFDKYADTSTPIVSTSSGTASGPVQDITVGKVLGVVGMVLLNPTPTGIDDNRASNPIIPPGAVQDIQGNYYVNGQAIGWRQNPNGTVSQVPTP